MTTYSKPAKALAVLTFTSGVITDEKAVELFDLITQAENEDAIEAVLEEHDFSPWDEVGRMKLMDWSEEINTLAQNYDRLAKEMAEPVPAPVAVAAQHRFRHPQKGMPDWSKWQQCDIAKRPAWTLDSLGWMVEYRELTLMPTVTNDVTKTD